MKLMNLIFLVAVAAAVGFAVGTVIWKKPLDVSPDDRSHEIEQLESRITLLTEELGRVREEKDSAEVAASKVEADLRDARETLTGQAAAAAEAVEQAEADEAVAALAAPRFFADSHSGVLRKVDWKVIGRNMEEMVRLISGLATRLNEGGEPDAKEIGRIQQLNGPLVTAALTVAEELPGRGVNGKFTDPSFQLNAIASTLAAADLPLSDGQAQTLEQTALDWMSRNEKRRAQYDETTIELQKTCEEAQFKQGFFDDAFSHLTEEQVNVLSPAASRGRIRMDIFSSGLIYVMNVKPEPVESTDQIAEKFLHSAAVEFGFSDSERAQAETIIRSWVNRLPRELVDWETVDLDRHGNLHAARATGWGLETVKLIKEVSSAITFDENRWIKARRHDAILVPLK